MPVSTRSQISSVGVRVGQESPVYAWESATAAAMRDPHRRLKEKMQALTLLYEQHRQAAAARLHPTHHPRAELVDPNRKKKDENDQEIAVEQVRVMKENSFPVNTPKAVKQCVSIHLSEAKENCENFDEQKTRAYPKKIASVAPAMTSRRLSCGGQFEAVTQGTRKAACSEVGENGTVVEKVGSRIMVFVRLRPMAKKEKEAGSRCCVNIVNRRDVYLTECAMETDYLRLKRIRGRHFCFDAAFPDSASQQEVYNTTTAELVEGVLQGRNGSVFCYGATGAGKTYTMLGTMESPGVMVLAIKDLFSKIRQRSADGNHTVHLSYLEVYNETVRDLLSPGRPLVLREDKQGIVAAGLTQYKAYSTDEVMALLQQGNLNRTTEPTRVNETSSRSHAILQVVAEFKVKESGSIVTHVGKLSLIDLAGSERALATDQRTQRSIEGANINRSLLALSSCINALVEGKKHIPYRNSKLTQLLKDSLGGPCHTVMIANISPSNISFGETQNTLHWADRTKEIRTKGSMAYEEITEVPESATDQAKLLLEMQKENSDLRQQLARLQQKLLTVEAQSLAANSACPPSPAPAVLPSSSPCSTQRKVKRSLLTANCFSTPESRKKGNNDTSVLEMHKAVKTLEVEKERMKKDHATQLKQKNDFIRELQKAPKVFELEMERLKKQHMMQLKQKDDLIRELLTKNSNNRVVTRATMRKTQKANEEAAGELKSPGHRFLSPVPTSKKRSFWDITAANSPSLITISGRKTKSHVAVEVATAPPPSMLLQLAYRCLWFVCMLAPHAANYYLQPGFARQRTVSLRN